MIEIPFYQVLPGLTFWQCLQRGLVPLFDCPEYIRWLHTRPCAVTGGRRDLTVHHVVGHGLKAVGGKTHDLLAFPLIAQLHLPDYPGGIHAIKVGHKAWEATHGDQLQFSARLLLEAVYEGVLKLQC